MPGFNWSTLGLCAAALAAGAINSLAGGGTLLTFPALLAALSMLPPAEAAVVANATSTVALVPGSIAGAWGYRGQLGQMRRWLMLLAVPSLLGGAIGAWLVTQYPKQFVVLVPWLLLTAALIFLKETIWPRRRGPRAIDEHPSAAHTAALMLFQFGVAIYGGYFGAGIGILMLSSLAIMRLGDIYQLNALKNLLACGINGVSAAVFIAQHRVAWQLVAPMAVSAIIGGYVGAKAGLKIEARIVRWIVVVIGLGLAGYYFYGQIAHARSAG
ncbi:MAG: sulfite exporter TauE/SafE family protein [Planctomycetia bacterium]|nr:sulfite exporter TauE/SafE family protein [Planctomycetia bacterium]